MNNIVIRNRSFTIEHDGTVVIVRQADAGDFDEALRIIGTDILPHFNRSEPGSIWGCDGIGYMIEKAHGIAFQNKSGVGPRKFKQGMASLLASI